jgi:hypothetical protein
MLSPWPTSTTSGASRKPARYAKVLLTPKQFAEEVGT